MDDNPSGEVQGTENAPGPNPAWNDVLSVLPEQFHSVVTPHFQQWDQAAQSKIEAANAKIKEFEPYQTFVEHGIDTSEIENGLRLMFEINNDPQKVWKALGEAYGLASQADNSAEGNSPSGHGGENEGQPNYQDPRFDDLQRGLELVSQITLQNEQAKANAQADAELDAEIRGLQEKFKDQGGIDERIVLGLMSTGMTADQAGQAWMETRNSLLQNNPRPFAPQVMGSSGGGTGYPSQAIDPTKLSGKDTRNLVAQMLAAEFGPRT